jgi:hypothetical protein
MVVTIQMHAFAASGKRLMMGLHRGGISPGKARESELTCLSASRRFN